MKAKLWIRSRSRVIEGYTSRQAKEMSARPWSITDSVRRVSLHLVLHPRSVRDSIPTVTYCMRLIQRWFVSSFMLVAVGVSADGCRRDANSHARRHSSATVPPKTMPVAEAVEIDWNQVLSRG